MPWSKTWYLVNGHPYYSNVPIPFMGEPPVFWPLTMAHMMSPQSLKTPRAGFQKVTLVWYRKKIKNNPGAEKQHVLLVHGLYWHIVGWVHFNINMYIIRCIKDTYIHACMHAYIPIPIPIPIQLQYNTITIQYNYNTIHYNILQYITYIHIYICKLYVHIMGCNGINE